MPELSGPWITASHLKADQLHPTISITCCSRLWGRPAQPLGLAFASHETRGRRYRPGFDAFDVQQWAIRGNPGLRISIQYSLFEASARPFGRDETTLALLRDLLDTFPSLRGYVHRQ